MKKAKKERERDKAIVDFQFYFNKKMCLLQAKGRRAINKKRH